MHSRRICCRCTKQHPVTAQQHHPAQGAAGDTLEHLALRYLGNASLWPALQSHNRVASPYRLQPGSILKFPVSCCARPQRRWTMCMAMPTCSAAAPRPLRHAAWPCKKVTALRWHRMRLLQSSWPMAAPCTCNLPRSWH
nr:LysM peptidoglycan-binding domain-containing protein [Comamonas jiangduensis]